MAFDLAVHRIPEARASARPEAMSVEVAYRVAAGGSLPAVRAALKLLGRKPSAQRTLLAATVDVMSGQVPRALHLLEVALTTAKPHERPYLVDLLAPLYVMINRVADLDGLVDAVPLGHPLTTTIAALRAVRDGLNGHRVLVHAAIDELAKYASCSDDDLLAGKVAQRLALAAYYVKAYELATSLAEASVQSYRRADAARLAVTSYSIIYNVHNAVTGDCLESLRAAQLMTEFAKSAGDRAYENIGLLAQYEIAAEMGDAERLHELRAQIRREALPEQFRERFACRVADFLPFAWEGNFEALRDGLGIARDALRLTPPMRALAISLMALAECALGNDRESRRLARTAMSLANLSIPDGEPAYDRRYRLLARAIAGSSCALLGAADLGHRALEAKAFASDLDLAGFIDVAKGRDYRELSVRNRGYGRAVQAARDSILACKPAASLTPAEHSVLRSLAEGMTAAQIAAETSRSISTVRNHTRSIIDKFDVSGRVAAVSHARKLGLLK